MMRGNGRNIFSNLEAGRGSEWNPPLKNLPSGGNRLRFRRMKPQTQPDVRYSAMGERMEPSVINDLMNRALQNKELLSIAAGFTDNVTLPQDLVGQAVAALTGEGGPKDILQYGLNQGRTGFREAIAGWLRAYPGERPDGYSGERVMVTNGSQQCLYLAMQMLCDPGDIILVERPSYFVFLEMLKGLGIEAVGMPANGDGSIDIEGTRALLDDLRYSNRFHRVKAVYLVGYYGNPSARCIPEAEKVALAELLESRDLVVPVIEDAAYRDLYFHRPFPSRTVFSIEAYEAFPKLLLGTFTKPFATGMKVGYGVCSVPDWMDRMLSTKGHHDFGTSNFSQAIIEYILERNLYPSYLDTLRRHYREKADRMHESLIGAGLRDAGWTWNKPDGGLLMWVRGPEHVDTRIGGPFCEACIERGVLYVPGDLSLTGNRPRNYVRLSYGALPADRLAEANRRFAEVARRFAGPAE